MTIQNINNEEDYQKALERLEVIFDAKKGTEESKELELLADLIIKYKLSTTR